LNFPKRDYVADTDARQWRRGVYMHWQRTYLHPMLKAFDAPSREECTAQRPRSNTPLAALVLLNDPSFIEAARVFAERILADGADTDDVRLDQLFRRSVSRTPDAVERDLLHQMLAESRAHYAVHRDAAQELVNVGLQQPGAIDPVELAAWTCVARAVLNLNETITRH
ncbi:MAG: DUF1553 domain-containing protein, partial [Planctomycetaceae bacterium]|nr:DUF1553 domain-containing protein [Planctomycetaceae bacterium]